MTRVALISGANRGIGRAIAKKFLADGWNISLGIRSGGEELGARPGVQVFPYDAVKGNEDEWVEYALEKFGRIDALIANAGVMYPKSVIDVTEEEFDTMWQVNVRATRRLAKAAFPSLEKTGSGRIVVIASLSSKRVASQASSSYAVTKHAVLALAHGLRQVGFSKGIRTTAICPSFVATDMARYQMAENQLDKVTQPEDIANIVSTVVSLPNTASVAEVPVNYSAEAMF